MNANAKNIKKLKILLISLLIIVIAGAIILIVVNVSKNTNFNISAISSNETLGTAHVDDRKFNIGDEITLTANFIGNERGDFLGWRANSINGELVSTTLDYTFKLQRTSPKKYYAIFSEQNEKLYFSLSSTKQEATLQMVSDTSVNIQIPSVIQRDEQYIVTSMIDTGVFSDVAETLESLILPDTLTRIGNNAFSGCTNLKHIRIPDSVKQIGAYAFSGCDNLNYQIDKGVKYISSVTNQYYALIDAKNFVGGEYEIKDSCKIVLPYAFSSCISLTNLVISDSVINLGERAFNQCTSLKNVIIGSGVRSVEESVFEDCNSLVNLIINDGVTIIGDRMFFDCSSLKNLTIPNSVTSIGSSAFYNCTDLSTVVISDNVKEIGDGAFYATNLTNIKLPNKLENLGDYVFEDCSNLMEIEIDENNQYYTTDEYGVLYDKNKLILIRYPAGNARTSYIIPEGVLTISPLAFADVDALVYVNIPNSVTSIGNSAFYSCYSLENVQMGVNITTIGKSAFYRCSSLTSITFPDNLRSIGNSAFYYCHNLQSVVLNQKLTNIESLVFDACYDLINVTINDYVYGNCSSSSSCGKLLDNAEVIYIPKNLVENDSIVMGDYIKNNFTQGSLQNEHYVFYRK